MTQAMLYTLIAALWLRLSLFEDKTFNRVSAGLWLVLAVLRGLDWWLA